jgi:hypothetical protein
MISFDRENWTCSVKEHRHTTIGPADQDRWFGSLIDRL